MRNLLWCLLLIGLVLNADALAQSELDTTFNSTGIQTISFGMSAGASDLAVQADNKIVMAGGCRSQNIDKLCIARYNENGSLDTTFGGKGFVLTDAYAAVSVAVQSDGKIVAVGFVVFSFTSESIVIVRYNADGTLDSSFGSGGTVIANLGLYGLNRGKDVAIQPDGKIVIVGTSTQSPTIPPGPQESQGVVARYLANGTLDSTFGNAGVFRMTMSNVTRGECISNFTASGKILIGGYRFSTNGSLSPAGLLVRLNFDGSLDATWDGDGYLTVDSSPGGPTFQSITTSDSRVVGVTEGNTIYRFHANGSLDTSFDGDGIRQSALDSAIPQDVIVSALGRITVVGYDPPDGFAISRFKRDGSYDTGFSGDGRLTLNQVDGSGFGGAWACASDSLGRILVGGYVGNGQTNRFAVLRLDAPVVSGMLTDFDGDNRTDVSVFRPDEGNWYIRNSSSSAFRAEHFGAPGDVIAPGDYDGDGKTDIAVFRPSSGYWYILHSSDNSFRAAQLGQAGDIPATGDYDGDAKSDICVFRPTNGTFYLIYTSSNFFTSQQWGTSGDVPVIGDYDGDARSDFAILRPSSNSFYILRSSDSDIIGQRWGTSGDKPVSADFDGDGKTDIAVYRPSTGAWYYRQSSDNGFRAVGWGTGADIPVAGDYDGDRKWDVAIFRPSTGTYYILQSTNGSMWAEQFGTTGDAPVAGAFVH
jgi:FG-GAP repeat.